MPNKNNKKTNIINLADDNNTPIRDNNEASNFMNDFFVTVGPNLAKEWDKHLSTYQGIYSNNDMPDIITDEREVLKLCTDINTTKSSAIEGLNSKMLKDAFLCLFRQLPHIFNLSFSTNIFPDDWKRTNVIPLPKDGDLTKCTNYRPISSLPLQVN